ncbi:hydrogen peroxide-dependent heme synthase [Protaetiibacter larvae]|uniref:Coproheme decarboxylase n=1 Tax=Protaetiibacter larvae TaxID=2592654 RepID=A0A5C1Y5M8_9MICO|nr:hydrogen peroxide-dependent heme synthase [Protaetiibacter larvae]QEO09096.1 chlorite dismutase family protein [Protaetiibacter larvae]
MTSATPVPSENPSGFALWAVWRRDPARSAASLEALPDAVAEIEASGVVLRGFYDVSGLRADADLMVWLHGDTAEGLQSAVRTLRRVPGVGALLPTWNALGVHREAEFSRAHAPSFLRGLPPKGWVTVYPFVRSYDWYLLPEDERRGMLADHGRKGSEYPSVQANTVASFALGDYEWLLALEADEVVDLVDLMRHLRNTEARRHVREEVPFFTGRRIGLDEIAEVLS